MEARGGGQAIYGFLLKTPGWVVMDIPASFPGKEGVRDREEESGVFPEGDGGGTFWNQRLS